LSLLMRGRKGLCINSLPRMNGLYARFLGGKTMLCDADRATELLGNRTKAQTYGQIASGWIPPQIVVRIGRTIRFKEDALRKFIEQGGAKTKQEGGERESTKTNQ